MGEFIEGFSAVTNELGEWILAPDKEEQPAQKNWLEAQLEEARKNYENWPDWKKKCSRTGEFIRNRNSSKDRGE